jgi:hypothetical protein
VARQASRLSNVRLRQLARAGAENLLNQLRAEIIAIERTFPELALPARRRQARQAVAAATRRGRSMSASARKAVSERMKKYWAERRKATAKVK